MSNGDIKFTLHAVERMREREIEAADVLAVLATGVIAERGRANTHIGWVARPDGRRAVGVIAREESNGDTVIITVFWIDPLKWNADFTERLK